VPALDGLRGAAILLVFVTHASSALVPAGAFDAAVKNVANAGWIGVDLFFVISGFLITGILLDTRDATARWRNFFARRVLRIFPLYYGVLVFLFVVLPLLWSHPLLAATQADQAWYWGYAVNFLELKEHGQWQPLYTGHLWSLAIEEQFYLLWPLVVWACTPRTLGRVAVGTMATGFLLRVWFAIADLFQTAFAAYLFTPTHLDGLMVGALLAVLTRSEDGLTRLRPHVSRVIGWGLAMLVGLAVVRGGFRADDSAVTIVGFPLLAIVFGAVLVTAIERRGAARLFENPVLRWLGIYSYGLYVFHLPVIGGLQWLGLISYRRGVPEVLASRLPAVIGFAAVAALVSCALAWSSYHTYEKRFLALKGYFA